MELRQGSLATPGLGIDPHQLAVCLFVERLSEERLLEGRDCRGPVADVLLQTGEANEEPEVALAQCLAPAGYPLLKAVLGQQLTPVEINRLPVALDTRGALGIGRRLLELLHVDAQPIGRQREALTRQFDPRGAILPAGVKRAAGDEQRLAQIVGSRSGIASWPQRLNRLLTVQRTFGRERQELDQRARLAQPPAGLRHRRPTRGDLKAAKEFDP
jgi:hypothetical protein